MSPPPSREETGNARSVLAEPQQLQTKKLERDIEQQTDSEIQVHRWDWIPSLSLRIPSFFLDTFRKPF
jgi:hypothetical protein